MGERGREEGGRGGERLVKRGKGHDKGHDTWERQSGRQEGDVAGAAARGRLVNGHRRAAAANCLPASPCCRRMPCHPRSPPPYTHLPAPPHCQVDRIVEGRDGQHHAQRHLQALKTGRHRQSDACSQMRADAGGEMVPCQGKAGALVHPAPPQRPPTPCPLVPLRRACHTFDTRHSLVRSWPGKESLVSILPCVVAHRQ